MDEREGNSDGGGSFARRLQLRDRGATEVRCASGGRGERFSAVGSRRRATLGGQRRGGSPHYYRTTAAFPPSKPVSTFLVCCPHLARARLCAGLCGRSSSPANFLRASQAQSSGHISPRCPQGSRVTPKARRIGA